MKFYKSILAATALSLLVGCGGSSSNNDGESVTITGSAVDGYLQSATVCLDLNMDGYCQIGDEPATSTKDDGSYALTVTAEQKSHENYDIAPLIVYDGKDSDTGKRFDGKLSATNNGDAINITPLTTLVEQVLKDDYNSTMTADEKKAMIEKASSDVKTALGLDSSVDLSGDPIALKESNPELLSAALCVQKSIETMASASSSANSSDKKTKSQASSDIYKAFAQIIGNDDVPISSQAGNISASLNNLIDAAVEDNNSKALMGDEAAKAKDAAQDMAKQADELLDAGLELTEIATLIQQDLDEIESEFDKIDSSVWSDDTQDIVIDVNMTVDDDIATESFNLRLMMIKAEIKFLLNGANDAASQAIYDAGHNVWDLYDDDIYNTFKNDDVLNVVYEAIKKVLEGWDIEESNNEDEAVKNADSDALVLSNGFEINFFWGNDNDNNNLEFEHGAYTLNIGTSDYFSGIKKVFDSSSKSWIDKDSNDNNDDYDLSLSKDGKWVDDSSENISVVLSEEKTAFAFVNGERLSFTKEDISGKEVYVSLSDDDNMEIKEKITFPSDSYRYLEVRDMSNSIGWYDLENTTSYSTFSELLSSNCGNEARVSFHGYMVSFGNDNCADMTKGTLLDANDLSHNVGDWEYKTVAGVKMIVMTDSHDDGEFFAMYNNAITKGDFYSDDSGDSSFGYNGTAATTIENYIKDNYNDLNSEYSSGNSNNDDSGDNNNDDDNNDNDNNSYYYDESSKTWIYDNKNDDNSNNSFTISTDEKVLTFSDIEIKLYTSNRSSAQMQGLTSDVELTSTALEYVVEFHSTKDDDYRAHNKYNDSSITFSGLISNHCGDSASMFRSLDNDNNRGFAFKECITDAVTGTLILVDNQGHVIDNSAGTWTITDMSDGKTKIMKLDAKDEYTEHEEKKVMYYGDIDNRGETVWYGDYENDNGTQYNYNSDAAELIKSAMLTQGAPNSSTISDPTVDGLTQISWKVNGDEPFVLYDFHVGGNPETFKLESHTIDFDSLTATDSSMKIDNGSWIVYDDNNN